MGGCRSRNGLTAAMSGTEGLWTSRSTGSTNREPRRRAGPAGRISSMALIDLPYLWLAQDRSRKYWYYRRNGLRIPITSPNGERLFPEDAKFIEAYRRIHASFEKEASTVGLKVVLGTLGHGIPLFLADPETKDLKPKTQTNYR